MKIRTIKQFTSDSFKGIVRNRIMSIASIGTVAATLFIFGSVLMMALNLNNMVESVGEEIEIKVFVDKKLTQEQVKAMEPKIKAIPNIQSIKFETKDQALNKMKEQLGDQKDLAKGMEAKNPLPESYVIRVDAPENVEKVAEKLKTLEGVYKINDSKSTVQKIMEINNIVKTSSAILMGVFGIVALFLIANTIKLTVYARKREIEIMKYIGATDWFIRWPFVIEGVILGLIGSIISIIILSVSYSYMSETIQSLLMMFKPVPFGEMIGGITWKFLLLGIGIGGLGSVISLRKFLQV
ncbi:MAG: permease-like cell division protein FtsX [Clostridium sp.]